MPKKAKKQTKEPIFTITVKAYEDKQGKRVDVAGHPNNLFIALDIIAMAEVAIKNQFQQLAAAGRLDQNLTITESNIVQVKSPLVGPDGKRLN